MKLEIPLAACSSSGLASIGLAASHLAHRFDDGGDHGVARIFAAVALGAGLEERRRVIGHGTPVDTVTIDLDDADPKAVHLASEMAIAAAVRLRDANGVGPVADVWNGVAAELVNERSRRRWSVVALERQLGAPTLR